MSIAKAFLDAFINSPISHLEMSWSLKVDHPRFMKLLNGEANPTPVEETEMYKFVMKERRKENESIDNAIKETITSLG